MVLLLYRVAHREEGLSPSAAGTPNAVGDVSPSPAFETSVAGVRMRETSPVSAPARRDGGPLPPPVFHPAPAAGPRKAAAAEDAGERSC